MANLTRCKVVWVLLVALSLVKMSLAVSPSGFPKPIPRCGDPEIRAATQRVQFPLVIMTFQSDKLREVATRLNQINTLLQGAGAKVLQRIDEVRFRVEDGIKAFIAIPGQHDYDQKLLLESLSAFVDALQKALRALIEKSNVVNESNFEFMPIQDALSNLDGTVFTYQVYFERAIGGGGDLFKSLMQTLTLAITTYSNQI